MKKEGVEYVSRQGMGFTMRASSPSTRPVIYSEDIWDIAKDSTELKDFLGTRGSYSQTEINEQFADKLNTIGSNLGSGMTVDERIETKIGTLSADTVSAITTVNTTLGGQIGALSADTYNALTAITEDVKATINSLDASVSGTNNGVTVSVVEADGKLTSLSVTAPDFESLYDANGAASTVGQEITAIIGGDYTSANTISSAITTLQNAVGEGGSVTAQINSAITALDAAQSGTNDYMSVTVTQTDGKLTSVLVNANTGLTDYLLTDTMKDYLIDKLREKLQAEAEAKYSITTTVDPTGTTYDMSVVAESNISNKVIAHVTFNGYVVSVGTTPLGWIKEGNDYTKMMNSSTTSVPATNFTYTVPSGTYKDITVTKSSAAKSITKQYPAWYGVFTSKNASDASQAVKGAKMTKTLSNANNGAYATPVDSANDTYFWIISKGESTCTQSGSSIVSKTSGVTLSKSVTGFPNDLTGYNVYICTTKIDKGGSMNNLNLAVRVS